MGKYIPKENDIEITGDWLINNGFEVIGFNTYKRDYYVLVEKGDMSNTDGGTKTEKLKAHRINKITIIISE